MPLSKAAQAISDKMTEINAKLNSLPMTKETQKQRAQLQEAYDLLYRRFNDNDI